MASRYSRFSRVLVVGGLVSVALLAQFASSLSVAPGALAAPLAPLSHTPCAGGGAPGLSPQISVGGGTYPASTVWGTSITASPVMYSHTNQVDGSRWVDQEWSQLLDNAGNVVYDTGWIVWSGGLGSECNEIDNITTWATWVTGAAYTLRLKYQDNTGAVSSSSISFTVNLAVVLPSPTAVPPTATVTPTAPACTSFGGSDPVWQYPVGIQSSLTPDGRFYYQSAAAHNMAGYDWYVLDTLGNILFHKGFQSLVVSPGCSVSVTVPVNVLQYGDTYCLQAITKDSSGTNSALVKDCFSVITAFGSGSGGGFVPGGGGSSGTVSGNISYACNNPPLIDNSDNRGGMPAIISWIWCQVQHLDMLAPFEGLIDPFIGNLFSWFKNWNGFFGPAWSDLNNLAGSISTLWNNLTGIKTGIMGAVNSLLSPIRDIAGSITGWFVPHPTDFIPFQAVLGDINSREPFHFMFVFVNQYIDISNQFWSAAGLHTADIPAISSSTSLGCHALPNDVPSATATATVAATAVPTDIPVVPTPTYNPPPSWPTPPWGYVPPARGVSYVVDTPTPAPTYAGWNGVSCSAVAINQVPSDTGASSGGSLPVVPNIVPQVPDGSGGYADAYVANPLSGSATSSSSYGVLGDGIAMFIDLLSHMGISRDNFAKIIDLFIIVAAVIVIGKDLGVGAGELRRLSKD